MYRLDVKKKGGTKIRRKVETGESKGGEEEVKLPASSA